MGEWISILSFIMAVIGALAAIFIDNRDKQTMASIVGFVFLLSFFITVSKESTWILQSACIVAVALSLTGGTMAIFSNKENMRTGAMVTGVISLGITLLILFSYLGFDPF